MGPAANNRARMYLDKKERKQQKLINLVTLLKSIIAKK